MSLQDQKIYLLGFMGSGKSTVGKALADKINSKFVDLDRVIEVKQHKTIAEIFTTEGEDSFRNIESEALKHLTSDNKVIVSLGGGTPCFNKNMDLIRASGTSIYLHLPPEKLAERLLNETDHRPVIKEAENLTDLTLLIREKLTKREKFYIQANYIVSADKLVEEIVDEITCLLTP